MSSTRVTIYARVSTRDQNCELQLADLEAMATARGFEVAGRYIDQGISGAQERRPALDKLMADASRGKFQTVAVWKFDRFARSLKHLIVSLEEFRALGVDFISYREAVDTSTPAGKMLFSVIGAMAEFERELIRERVAAGLARARAKGVRLGRPRAEFDLARARELRHQGLSLRGIAKQLGVNKDTLRAALALEVRHGRGAEVRS